LESAGVPAGDREGHLVTVQELLQTVKGFKDVPDSSRLERIGEVVASMDDDSDGIVKIEHVNKVIELLGRDNVNLSTKQVKNIIDLIGKEEMLEVERRIEKILGKIPSTEALEAKIAEAAKEEEMVDNAKDLSDDASQHLFKRPSKQQPSSEATEESSSGAADKEAVGSTSTTSLEPETPSTQITKISEEQLKGLSGATVRNAADLALLTREQELAALSARKTLADAATSSNIREKSPEMEILSRAEDVLQKRIMEDAGRIQGGINNNVADSALRAADALAAEEDNSVKEVAEKEETDLIQSGESQPVQKVPRKNGTNH